MAFILNNFKQYPKLILDPEKKFFAIYSKKDGLRFSKTYNNPTFKQKKLMKKMGESNYKKIENNNYIFCKKEYCIIENEKLIIKDRMKKSEICNFKEIINMTKKYDLPEC